MTDFVATKVVNIFETVEEAVADLETQLEATDNSALVKTSKVLKIDGGKYASILVWTTTP